MNVNQLMAKLRTEQKNGNGNLKVHFIAHDNCEGETQGEISSVFHYEKDCEVISGDNNIFHTLPNEVVYLGI